MSSPGPDPASGGYGVVPPQPTYTGGYATAPAPGHASGDAGAYAPPTASYGRAPEPAPPGGQRRAGPNPGATIGWVGFALAFLVGFIGIVLGAISISRSRRVGASIRVGVLAVVVGTLQVLAIVVVVLLLLILNLTGGIARENPGDTDVTRTVPITELTAGNCIDIGSLTDDAVDHVPCGQGHDGEVITLLSFTGTAYPGESALYDDAVERCYEPVSAALPPRVDPLNLYVDAFVPTQAEWDAGNRAAACLLVSEGEMTGSATAGDLVAPIG